MLARYEVERWPSFKYEEVRCPCGECDGGMPDFRFMDRLQALRTAYGKPMTLESCVRCEKHNKGVGGATSSQHVRGRAADVVVRNVADRFLLVKLALEMGFGGIGINRTTVHVDDRRIGAMWHYYK